MAVALWCFHSGHDMKRYAARGSRMKSSLRAMSLGGNEDGGWSRGMVDTGHSRSQSSGEDTDLPLVHRTCFIPFVICIQICSLHTEVSIAVPEIFRLPIGRCGMLHAAGSAGKKYKYNRSSLVFLSPRYGKPGQNFQFTPPTQSILNLVNVGVGHRTSPARLSVWNCVSGTVS